MVYGSSLGASSTRCSEDNCIQDDLLLKLYYVYEKSLRKCRELEVIISDLKECFNVFIQQSSHSSITNRSSNIIAAVVKPVTD